MKRILLNSALAVTLAATAALAQQPAQQSSQQPSGDATTQQPSGHYGHRGHHKIDPQKAAQRLGKRLNLSADQTAKLEPIFAAQQQKMTELHSNTSLTQDQRREQAKAIFKDTHDQLSQVLTTDQMQQLKSMRHNFRGGKRQQQPDSTTPPSNS